MAINPDFKDLFRIFNDCHVEYLVIGAHAVVFHTRPRFTKDLDMWVNPTKGNAAKVWEALQKFGAPLKGVTEESFTDRQMVYQIGVEPNRIDIMMGTPGVEFDVAWANRAQSTYGDIPIGIIGRAELLKTKLATGRPQDLLDADDLKKGT
ncbi:MAG TPA: hypothetical protein VL171_14765 [Verrucomicrobiae bacterium]|nr:hypothetical protein [Verrucomicrobiae bacterium]